MMTFYSRPDDNGYVVPALFLLIGLSQVVPPFYGQSPSDGGAPVLLVWNMDTVGRFCLGLIFIAAVYWVWPRPYWVEVSERGIRRIYGAGFWGDHTARRFSIMWVELQEWSFRNKSIQNGEEWFQHDFIYLVDGGGRQFCLGGFSAQIRDELKRWVPEKEHSAEPGEAPDTGRR